MLTVSPREAGRALAGRVADAIEAHPRQFFQRQAVHWLADEDLCGIPAGIDGWAAAVLDDADPAPVAERRVRKYGAWEVARRALALSEEEADVLFDPAPFGDHGEPEARDAAAALRRYAGQGLVQWVRRAAQGTLL